MLVLLVCDLETCLLFLNLTHYCAISSKSYGSNLNPNWTRGFTSVSDFSIYLLFCALLMAFVGAFDLMLLDFLLDLEYT